MGQKKDAFSRLTKDQQANLLEAVWDLVVDNGEAAGFFDALGLDPEQWDEDELKVSDAVDALFEHHVR